MRAKHYSALVISIIVSELVGMIGERFTTPAISTWYASLIKPVFTPPNWVFGPVWMALFLLMGIAAFLVWYAAEQKKTTPMMAKRQEALILFGIQLVVNTAWSIVFFGFRNPGLALVVIGILWALVFGKIILFSKLSRTAALLLVPYLGWISFAAYLNYFIWILN